MTSNQHDGTYTFECTDQEHVPAYSQIHYDEDSLPFKTPSRAVQMTVSSSSSSGSSQRTYSCKITANITQPSQTNDGLSCVPENECLTNTKPTWLIEKEILDRLELPMLQYMDARSLVPLLKARWLISQDDEECINGQGDGCRRKNKYILDIIPKKGEKALFLFLECLQEEREHRGHDTLAKMLQEECIKAGYIEIQRGEAWGDATGKTSRCTSCSHDQIEVPSRGTPMPMACDIEEERVHINGDIITSEQTNLMIRKLQADLKIWKEVADKFIKENLELKIQNVELRHENAELKQSQQVPGTGVRRNSAFP